MLHGELPQHEAQGPQDPNHPKTQKPRRRALQATRGRGERGIEGRLRSESALLDGTLEGLATDSENDDGDSELNEFHD